MFGRTMWQPRLLAYVGDPGTDYVYSRDRYEPEPWTKGLRRVRDLVVAAATGHAEPDVAGFRPNSVLCNLYRDGQDSMGFHADDEPELGERPVIASISLGAARRFVMRHRGSGPSIKVEFDLGHGSLLWMHGTTQEHWQHGLPKTRRAVGERINLTFRRIRIPVS
jgi:alkylated DNA repair dioxygenase AlkB